MYPITGNCLPSGWYYSRSQVYLNLSASEVATGTTGRRDYYINGARCMRWRFDGDRGRSVGHDGTRSSTELNDCSSGVI